MSLGAEVVSGAAYNVHLSKITGAGARNFRGGGMLRVGDRCVNGNSTVR